MTLAKLNADQIISHALDIAREYSRQGLTLTLRQLYYQFVARGLIENGQKSYKKIGRVLTDARYSGTFPVEYIEDRGRTVHAGGYFSHDVDVEEALRQAAEGIKSMPRWYLTLARWWGQPYHVSVWFEKEALTGVFEQPCQRAGVSWFACKGYPSVSSLQEWIRQTDMAWDLARQHLGDEEVEDEDEPCVFEQAVILYAGDHDPDGMEIPIGIERNIERLRQLDHDRRPYSVRVERIALEQDQIERLSPPPFPAKKSGARCQAYMDAHPWAEDPNEPGKWFAWELDALEPTMLRGLVRDAVADLFDMDIARANREDLDALRTEMRDAMSEPEWMAQVWDD